ncbi:phosphoadenylyl-sulfate reductase [Ammoniphilus resinae]
MIMELRRLEDPQKLLKEAYQLFAEEMVLACSFGAEDVVLVDMASKIIDSPKIFYLDTDLHFQETYDTRDRLKKTYGIEFIQVKPDLTLEQQAEKYGDKLWEKEPNQCCAMRKVEPLQRILSQNKAWITGIRREQSITRANAQRVEWDDKFKLLKFNPLVEWTNEQVWTYIKTHQVPYNPLHDQHYPSIGCSVCTKQVKPGQDPRSGRWAGFTKTECGLHK